MDAQTPGEKAHCANSGATPHSHPRTSKRKGMKRSSSVSITRCYGSSGSCDLEHWLCETDTQPAWCEAVSCHPLRNLHVFCVHALGHRRPTATDPQTHPSELACARWIRRWAWLTHKPQSFGCMHRLHGCHTGSCMQCPSSTRMRAAAHVAAPTIHPCSGVQCFSLFSTYASLQECASGLSPSPVTR